MRFDRVGGRFRIVAVVAVIVLVLAFAALVVWNRDLHRGSAVDPGTSCPVVVAPKHRPPLTAPGVHRVALIGDSIMLQASCSAAASLATAGIETGRYAVSGSGLLTGFVDWVRQTNQILRTEHPDVVVGEFIGNYLGPPLRSADGRPIAAGSATFFDRWQKRAQALSDEVRATGAQLYWVSPPPLYGSKQAIAQRLFHGYGSIPGDFILDSGPVLAGPDGKEVLAKMTCGHLRVIRNVDGVHLSDDGARLYGQQIAHDLTAQLGLFTTPKPC